MATVNQIRPHCADQMGKTHSKPLAARHGRGTAWARHAMRESALTVLLFARRQGKLKGLCHHTVLYIITEHDSKVP